MGYPELLLILVLALLLFGAKRIPDLARSIGKSIHAFKEGMKESSGNPGDEENRKSDPSDKP